MEKLLLVLQSRRSTQVAPLKAHHLYWYGAVPPLAVAVKMAVVPMRTELEGLTLKLVTESAVVPAAVTRKSRPVHASGG
jgi:hypothetical protein